MSSYSDDGVEDYLEEEDIDGYLYESESSDLRSLLIEWCETNGFLLLNKPSYQMTPLPR